MVQGMNSSGAAGYAAAPPDKTHTYVITVYALDTALDLQAGFSQTELTNAMEGHILALGELDAQYSN